MSPMDTKAPVESGRGEPTHDSAQRNNATATLPDDSNTTNPLHYLSDSKDVVQQLRSAARSENTNLAYRKAWRRFTTYCTVQGIEPHQASPDDIVNFFTGLAIQPSTRTGRPLSLATLKLYRSALNRRYADLKRPSPAATPRVGDVFAGLSRISGYAPRRVKALREQEIKAMLKKCNSGRFGCRDAAIIAIGFGAALRRSEICNLRVSDIDILGAEQMTLTIRRSKTDQEGKGQLIAVPEGKSIKPITRLQNWLDIGGIRDGYLFQTFSRGGQPSGRALSHSEVPRIVKKYTSRIGLNPMNYSGHSLRAGFVTSAAAHHARLDKIMEVTRHRNPSTVLQYIRDANLFENHAGSSFL